MIATKVAVVTDTTACIPPDILHEYGIELVHIELIIDGQVYHDGIDITPTEFYAKLKKTVDPPSTSGSMPEAYIDAYEKACDQGQNVFCITEPASFSGMYNSAVLARDLICQSRPELNIEIMESSTAAAGLGLVAMAASRAAAEGQNLAKVISTAKSVMSRVFLFAALDTLSYLVNGGRVPRIAELANSVLHFKPVFTVNCGEASTVALPRTTKGVMREIIRHIEAKMENDQPLHVAVMHAAAPERAAELKNQISAKFSCADLFITEFTPVMGIHTGPGVIGASFYADN